MVFVQGLVALRARSEPSPVGSSSGYATPPPPPSSSSSQTLAGDVALALCGSNGNSRAPALVRAYPRDNEGGRARVLCRTDVAHGA
jgi:hypothetical protein